MTKALTLDEARDALKMAAVEFVSDFAYRRQSAHDLVGPLEALIDAKLAERDQAVADAIVDVSKIVAREVGARQEIAALSDGDRTRAEDASVEAALDRLYSGNGYPQADVAFVRNTLRSRNATIADLRAQLDEKDRELAALKHDIERHIAIAAEHATEENQS